MAFQGVSEVLVSYDLFPAHDYRKMSFFAGYQTSSSFFFFL
jgi:hypothetical protein